MVIFSKEDLEHLYSASFLKPSNSCLKNIRNQRYQSYFYNQKYLEICSDYSYTFFLQDYRNVCILPIYLQKILPQFIKKFFQKKAWVELPYMVCIFPIKENGPLVLWYCLEYGISYFSSVSFEEIFDLVSDEVKEEMIFYFGIFKKS